MGLLITGGFGYVGSAILELIMKDEKFAHFRENEIHVFDQLQRQTGFCVYRKAKENLPKLNFILGDIADLGAQIKKRLQKAVEESDRIIHLCSITQQPFVAENRPIIVDGTRLILRMIQNHNPECQRMVFVSTTNTYGYFAGDQQICSEETAPNPVSVYAECKVEAEKLCRQYWEKFKSPVISIRLSTNFGYADGIRLDFFLNNMIWNAMFSSKVSVFGRKDNWRPFIHVRDAANAILNLTLAEKKFNGRLYNVGSEALNLPLYEIVEQIESAVGKYREDVPEFVFDSDLDNSVKGESYRVDFSKFRRDFDFQPSVSLAEGIEEMTQKLAGNWSGNRL